MIRSATVLLAASMVLLASCATKKECATCDSKAKAACCSKDGKACCKSGHKH
jgi:hypothetical protein|uniref:hypothetical protein n=1 Tax=Prosthecobacter sp. TaxID=1965333 RepID=UPI003783BE2C